MTEIIGVSIEMASYSKQLASGHVKGVAELCRTISKTFRRDEATL